MSYTALHKNDLLLEQLGVVGKPSEYKAKRYRSKNELLDVTGTVALISVAQQYSVIDSNPNNVVSYDNWVISLMRHPEGDYPDHAMLILEGFNQFGKAFFVKLHLVADEKNSGTALIIVQHYPNIDAEDREIFFKRDLAEQKMYICKSWNISRKQGLSLLQDAQADKERTINYHVSGNRSIFSASAQSSSSKRGPVHNCFTWVRAKLLNLNDLRIQLPEKFTDFIGAKTSFYLPETEKGNCLVM